MKQEIEIEFKNILTKNEFERLLESYPFQEAFKQTNYYFETRDLQLSKLRSALRIREKNGRFTATLKQPYEGHLLESHISLSEEEAKQCINGNFIHREDFSNHLKNLGIHIKDLIYLGELTTYRRTFIDKDNLFVLDHSLYNGLEDYEFELEVKDAGEGKTLFLDVLEKYDILLEKTPSKIERFYNSLQG